MRSSIILIKINSILIIIIIVLYSIPNNNSYSKSNVDLNYNLYDIALSSNSIRSNENILKINYTEAGTVDDFSANKGDFSTKLGIGKPGATDPRNYIIWLKFDLSLLHSNMDILSAKIFLFMITEGDMNDPPIFIHYSSDDSWTESSITGTSYPEYEQDYSDKNIGPFSSGKWYSWNVTDDVNIELTDNKILSEMISNHENVGFKAFNKKIDYPSKEPYIEIKFKTVSNLDVELTNGQGNGTEIYASNQYYNFNTQIFSYNNPENVDSAIICFDPDGIDLKISWDRINNRIIEISDDYGCISFGSFSSNYDNNIWNLNISIKFDLTYPMEKLSNIKLESLIGSNILDSDFFNNVYIIRKNLILTGNPEVNGEYQGPLNEDDWVRGNENLIFSGLKVVYESDNSKSPLEGSCEIKVYDDMANEATNPIDDGGCAQLSLIAKNAGSGYNNYRFSITPSSADYSSINPFTLKIDDKAPSDPNNFEIHADSPIDISTDTDNDDTIYLSWSSAVETDSGIKGYYYGEVGAAPAFTTDTNGQIYDLDEGVHHFEVYAEDNVGNIGDKNTASMIIDLRNPEFNISTPDENTWMNKTPVSYSITITDRDGSGVDTNTIEYSLLKSGSDEWGTWQKADGIINAHNDTIVTAKKELNLPEGKENYIKWRVFDLAGNGPIESKAYRIMVDTKPVMFSDFSPSNSEKRNITANITIKDTSGIGSFEYRLKLTGDTEYGSWQMIDILEFDTIKTVSIPMELPFGNTHKIQFRAEDIAGNGIKLSGEYQIKINSKPNVVIVSPDPEATYKTSDLILFDASGTTDEDNDVLKYWWESDITGELRRTAVFSLSLTYGTHKITLRVTDEGGHIVNVSFDLEVLPVDTDGDGLDDSEDDDYDGDGMPDYWEYINGLNALNNDAQNDKDGDGYTNKEEYNAGTDPSDKDSHPKGLSSSMVSTIIVLVVVMLIIIIAMGIGFILYRRNVKKRLIVPEVVSKPGVPGGVALPGGVPTSEALPGTSQPAQIDAVLPGPPASAQQHQYLLPEHKMSPEEILYQLDQRFVMGEISEETYKELKMKYELPPVQDGKVLKKKKIKKKKKVSPPLQEQENEK